MLKAFWKIVDVDAVVLLAFEAYLCSGPMRWALGLVAALLLAKWAGEALKAHQGAP